VKRWLLIFIPFVAMAAVATARSSSVPPVEQRRIVAEFGRTWLPPRIPAGYIYIRWQVDPGSSADVFGDRLLVWFGKHGPNQVIQWHVEISADPAAQSHQDCDLRHHFGVAKHLGARTIYYVGGAVGQSATLCLPNHYAVVAWNRYSLSEAALLRLVASARHVG
jgi:hypothetical protein